MPETTLSRATHRDGLGRYGHTYFDSLADTGPTRVPLVAWLAGATGQGGDPLWETLSDPHEAFLIFPNFRAGVIGQTLHPQGASYFSDVLYFVPSAPKSSPAVPQLEATPTLAFDRVLTTMREQAGLPVGDLARLLGISRRQFYNWLSGENQPDSETEKGTRDTSDLIEMLFSHLGDARLVRSALLARTAVGSVFDLLAAGDLQRARSAVELLGEQGALAEETIASPPPPWSSREQTMLELGHLRDGPRRGDD